jgi:hypothetical protein
VLAPFEVVPAKTAEILRVPTPNFSLIEAVPALVSYAVPRRFMSVQCAAEALQNFTSPVFTAEGFVTAAVKVTTVPAFTELDESDSATEVEFTACVRAPVVTGPYVVFPGQLAVIE